MRSIRAYSPIDRNEYFQLTQFDRSSRGPATYEDLVKLEADQGEVRVGRVQINHSLAAKILKFIGDNEISTRGSAPDITYKENPEYSYTVFTVFFSLHIVAGKRGGWYILESGGREPYIKDEFIEYGAKKKSGGRKHRYRRHLSYSEKNQVAFLESKTPSMVKMYKWILKKYPNDIVNSDVSFGESKFLIF